MSAFPNLPFDTKKLPEAAKFILPQNDLLELYNENYQLIGIFNESKKELLYGEQIAKAKGFFDLTQ